jgi:hypothetical protein
MLPDYNPTQHLPPPVPLPTLTVNAKGCVFLSRALAAKLNLTSGQPIDLLPPGTGSPYWHLDTRPTARRRLYWYVDTRPRLKSIQVPAGLLAPGQLLTLQLLPGEPAYPGFYPLLLANALATQAHQTPLAARTA